MDRDLAAALRHLHFSAASTAANELPLEQTQARSVASTTAFRPLWVLELRAAGLQSAWLKLTTFLAAASSTDSVCQSHVHSLQQHCGQQLAAIWDQDQR